MVYYKDGAVGKLMCVAFIAGLIVSAAICKGVAVATIAGIDPQLLRVADHVCRNNSGPKVIDYTWKQNVFHIRCQDGALFQSVEAKFDDKVVVGGAELSNK